MRRWAPAFAHRFGIRPWELDRLTWQQFEDLRDWLEAQQEG